MGSTRSSQHDWVNLIESKLGKGFKILFGLPSFCERVFLLNGVCGKHLLNLFW
jgi:hypothetical protein